MAVGATTESPLLPHGMVVGGHSGPRASDDSRTLYLKAKDGYLGSKDGYGSLAEAEDALRKLTSGPKEGAALIREYNGRFYGQRVFGLDVKGHESAYDLEGFAKLGKVTAGVLNQAVRMIVDGDQTVR